VTYDHQDAILHSVSEGLIVLDRNGVALTNDEARRSSLQGFTDPLRAQGSRVGQ
jgi:sensor histidine kinase regulating citrate/malate metabolism